MQDIILQYTYPRIDAEVSKHRNHLLKAPFCVHPGTGMSIIFGWAKLPGRVCVPVNPLLVDQFDPEAVPTVGDLLNELDSIPATDEDSKGRKAEGESTAVTAVGKPA